MHQKARESASTNALRELAAALDLPSPVSSIVVFFESRAEKSDYRHFTMSCSCFGQHVLRARGGRVRLE
jgi:hypothetical protein